MVIDRSTKSKGKAVLPLIARIARIFERQSMLKPDAFVAAKKSCHRADTGGDDLILCASSDRCDIASGVACDISNTAVCPCSQQEQEDQQQSAYYQHGTNHAAFGSHISSQDSHSYLAHPHQAPQSKHSRDGSINGTFAGMALHGADSSASNSPIAARPTSGNRQSHLCYDYASSSDCESDHCNPSTQVCYPNSGLTTSKASDDLNERGLNASHIRQSSAHNNSSSSSSKHPSQPYSTNIPSSTPTTKSCCKSSSSASSPSISAPPSPPPVVERGGSGAAGCGCAISPTMCCCGEFCACPGCLAYPNNQPLSVQEYQDSPFSTSIPVDRNPENYTTALNTVDQGAAPKGSCCGSNKANGGTRGLNLGEALTLIGVSHQTGSVAMNDEMRQALQQGFGAMDQATLDSVKMQHPTLLGSNGVLTCGCGCGRATVDCADCFRDMCEFVGESQARMMKEEFDYEMSMSREDEILGGQGLNRNMSSGMNSCHSTGMDLDDEPQQYHQESHHDQQSQRKLTEQEEALRLRRLEQEQMELSKLRPATFNQLQLDSLDDEDWSFVDEIRTDPLDIHGMISRT
ncbi:hypothetical protein BGX24_001417 [Mortierella sp. AD032]|nr:hypothetical protein BGX24_001417 [Mortierella sp. AD032]